ncbi:MAG: carbohydrate kinase family protein [bacterium]|nr:carbohydrate kinase family protein [bacterium]
MDLNPASFDLLTIGDATVDVFLTLQKIDEHCRLDKERNELCVKYGDKILVDDSQFLLGGNACNVGVACSGLKINTAFVTELGNDEFAEIILKGLKTENVNTSLVKETEGLRTNFAIILTFDREKVLFARHIPRSHDFSLDGILTKWVYLTSMGKEWKGAYQRTLDFVQKSGAKLAFNPGTTQLHEGLESFSDVVKRSDILFLNKQEAMEISNIKYQISNMKELLVQLKNMGSKNVVVTDNGNGSYMIDENGKMFYIDIFPGEAIQKTGAGDAYTSGFLSAIISGGTVQDGMKWGAINSAAVIQKVGAQIGLLTIEQMDETLKANTEFRAREI